MPDQRKHRGPHPKDELLFGATQIPALKAAVEDLAWLISKGYPEKAALKMVGDRYKLKARQRTAVLRSTCTFASAKIRCEKALQQDRLEGKDLEIDAFNLIITVESALSGSFIFEGMDSCFRDMASIHGTYKKVLETELALEKIGFALQQLKVGSVHWLLDKPVSNSGRMKTLLYSIAKKHDFNWTAGLYFNPDTELIQSERVVISSDSLILDHCQAWFNFSAHLFEEESDFQGTRIIRLK